MSFSVRVSVQQGGQWLYLQYIRPNGQPVWGPHKCNYVSRINHFSSAQRICREVFSSQMFPSGTRVQFHKQFFEPSRALGGEVSMKKLAAAFSGKHAEMLDARTAERLSGYHVGGISPFGQRKRVPTVFEEKALAEPYVVMNGGQRGLQVKLAPADAVKALGAIVTGVIA